MMKLWSLYLLKINNHQQEEEQQLGEKVIAKNGWSSTDEKARNTDDCNTITDYFNMCRRV